MNKDYFEKHKVDFIYLENLRVSGIINMMGAAPHLARAHRLSGKEATEILLFWMKNYKEIKDELQ